MRGIPLYSVFTALISLYYSNLASWIFCIVTQLNTRFVRFGLSFGGLFWRFNWFSLVLSPCSASQMWIMIEWTTIQASVYCRVANVAHFRALSSYGLLPQRLDTIPVGIRRSTLLWYFSKDMIRNHPLQSAFQRWYVKKIV